MDKEDRTLTFCIKEFGAFFVLFAFLFKMIGNPLGTMFKQNLHYIYAK